MIAASLMSVPDFTRVSLLCYSADLQVPVEIATVIVIKRQDNQDLALFRLKNENQSRYFPMRQACR